MLGPIRQNALQRILLLLIVSHSSAFKYKCPCKNEADCHYPQKDLGTTAEVFAFSNGTTAVDGWKWDTLTTLVVPSNFRIENEAQANTMCIAHSKGRKFSIKELMALERPLNPTSEDADLWIKTVLNIIKVWHADILTVDLLDFFAKNIDSTGADLKALAQVLVRLKQEVEEDSVIPFKMACIVPWKPPCANSFCDFASLSNDACDYFVIHPDSFIDHDNDVCVARATIPMTKLLYGISEYNVHHVPRGKMILGIPWHGYTYECASVVNNVCTLPRDKNSSTCDFSRRIPISYKDIVHDHETVSNADQTWFDAPNYLTMKGSKRLQVWYENKNSLTAKYELVHEMNLKGIALMYGDDLATEMTAQAVINDALMWSFVSHEFLIKTTTIKHHDLHYADNIAGVAVGCLLLGTALGAVLTCLALRSRIRKPKRSFLHQEDSQTDGFMDEDDPHL